MMNLTPLTIENIAYVMGHLSTHSLFEIEAFGLELSDARMMYESFIGKPFSLAIYDDANPFALIYLESIGTLRFKSHFLFTENGSKKVWRDLTKFLRGFSNRIVDDGGVIEMEAAMSEDDENIHRWYTTLGFRFLGNTGKTSEYIKGGKPCVAVTAQK